MLRENFEIFQKLYLTHVKNFKRLLPLEFSTTEIVHNLPTSKPAIKKIPNFFYQRYLKIFSNAFISTYRQKYHITFSTVLEKIYKKNIFKCRLFATLNTLQVFKNVPLLHRHRITRDLGNN